jgi:hypothetical protein
MESIKLETPERMQDCLVPFGSLSCRAVQAGAVLTFLKRQGKGPSGIQIS